MLGREVEGSSLTLCMVAGVSDDREAQEIHLAHDEGYRGDDSMMETPFAPVSSVPEYMADYVDGVEGQTDVEEVIVIDDEEEEIEEAGRKGDAREQAKDQMPADSADLMEVDDGLEAAEKERAADVARLNEKNNDLCAFCTKGGDLILCDGCVKAYHAKCWRKCIRQTLKTAGDWYCTETCKRIKAYRGLQEEKLGAQDILPLTWRHSFVSVMQLVCLLELRVPLEAFTRLFLELKELVLQGPDGEALLNAHIFGDSDKLGFGLELFMVTAADVVGVEQLEEIMDELRSSAGVVWGFGPGAGYSRHHLCMNCGEMCGLRTGCVHCWAPFSVERYVEELLRCVRVHHEYRLWSAHTEGAPQDDTTPSSGKTNKRLRLDNGDDGDAEVVDLTADSEEEDHIALKPLAPLPPSQRLLANDEYTTRINSTIKRGLEKFWEQVQHIMSDPAFIRVYGGDVLFLARNLALAAPPVYQQPTQAILRHAAIKFMELRTFISAESAPHCAEYMDILEGLHALHTLGVNGHDITAWNTVVEAALEAQQEGKPFGPIEAILIAEEVEKARRRPSKRKGKVDVDATRFDFIKVCKEWENTLKRFTDQEVLGFNPGHGKVPYTSPDHCRNCAQEHNKSLHCSACHSVCKSKIDYGALTDALVWLYVAREVGVEVRDGDGVHTLREILPLLSRVRDYRPVDEMGKSFFQLQGYFLTHLIYCASDWGARPIRKELFVEELDFILHNLHSCMAIDDPELTAEFIQCLKIMGVTRENNPKWWPYIEQGIGYLLKKEEAHGSCGLYTKAKRRRRYKLNTSEREKSAAENTTNMGMYDSYHATYCGTIALMQYRYLESPMKEVPVPSIFKIVLTEEDKARPTPFFGDLISYGDMPPPEPFFQDVNEAVAAGATSA